jgi:putative drug exporter of the RND superfamily
MSRVLFTIGSFAGRHPWRILAAWVLVAVSVFALNSQFGCDSTEKFSLPGAESQRAADAIEERFPQQTLYTANIIFHAPNGGVGNGPAKAAISEAVSQLADGTHVVGVTDPFDPRAPTLSTDGETAFTTVGYDTQEIGAEELAAAEAATRAARDAGVQVEPPRGVRRPGFLAQPVGVSRFRAA